jgi:hypothetical protein
VRTSLSTDIHPGDTVVVTGTAGSDGTVQARSIALSPAGGARSGGAATATQGSAGG